MTLGDLRRLFSINQAKLVLWCAEKGYGVMVGEVYRSNEQAEINAIGVVGRARVAELIKAEFPALASAITDNTGSGIRNSVHGDGVAEDMTLFHGTVPLSRTEDYRAAGEYWKSLHSLNRWGGDFSSPDAYHFSMEYLGRK